MIAIAEAAKEFDVGRRTLERLIAKGQLARYEKAGDRKTYVDREEVKAALGFKPKL